MFMHKLSGQVECGFDSPVVTTPCGRLRGLKSGTTYIFRGVRYAEAVRFHLPEPVRPWEGVRNAVNYGYIPPELTTSIPVDAYPVPHQYWPHSEHCQNLNIWTQSIESQAKKPVMVWIHGGGWTSGSALEQYAYDGEEMSAFADVVFVSVNHRLNALGYFDLSDYGDEYKFSCNAGLADLVMALQWIHDNISCFGGDPGNVTIMGQSGGGSKVAYLLQTPAADHLYHKAIMDSGGSSIAHEIRERSDLKELVKNTVEILGLTKETIHEIETVDYDRFACAVREAVGRLGNGAYYNWGPICDGEYFLGYQYITGFREETKDIPILNGSVFSEMCGNYMQIYARGCKNDWNDRTVGKVLTYKFGNKAEAVSEAFRKAYPDMHPVDVAYYDPQHRGGSLEFVKRRAAQAGAAPCWNWMFTYESPWLGGVLPWHGAELPFTFHNAQYIEASYIPGVAEQLQDQMAGAWAAFARTGDPNHSGIPEWKPVTEAGVPTMIFDRKCSVRTDFDKELLALLPDANYNGPPIMVNLTLDDED